VVAHLWQLRADPAPLEAGARRWTRVVAALTATADDIVAAARHVLDQGWESAAAERYEDHRRLMVQHLDTVTTVAARIGGSLGALAAMLRTAQAELDRAWAPVAAVPHELVGEGRVLVLHPASGADHELVRAATATAHAVRDRLDAQLAGESARLRGGGVAAWGVWPGGAASTSVPSGVVGGGSAPGPSPAAPVSLPALSARSGVSATALAAGAALSGALAGGAVSRRGGRREPPETDAAPTGGTAAGAALRGGSAARAGHGSGARPASYRPPRPAPVRRTGPERAAGEERPVVEVSEDAPGDGPARER
jgi:hypothetical protein